MWREEGTAEELERAATGAHGGLRATQGPRGSTTDRLLQARALSASVRPTHQGSPHRPAASPPACPTQEAPAVHLLCSACLAFLHLPRGQG